MSKELHSMLLSPTKDVTKARGILARLFRQIMMDLNITPMMFNNLMIKYLSNPANGNFNDGKSRSSERGNLIKEIRRPNMSWNVFLKCLRFLNPISIRFEVHLSWGGKRSTTIHGIDIKLANSNNILDLDDE